MTPTAFLTVLFALCVAHALADWGLQSEFVALYKSHKMKCEHTPGTIWPWLLLNHALLHGGMVFLATFNVWLGLTEFVVHIVIDYLKSNKSINFHTDQTLHFSFKLAYALLALGGIVTIHPWYLM